MESEYLTWQWLLNTAHQRLSAMKGDESVNLAQIFKNIDLMKVEGNLDLVINEINQDSRLVSQGDLFICIKGSKVDGHQFLRQAAEAGAVAAVVQDWPADNYGLTIIQVKDVAGELKEIAGTFYSYPDRRLKLIGVVGTNGKTTSTYLVKSILEASGYQVGLIGTINNLIKDQVIPSSNTVTNTTPGMLELQKLFAKMVAAGVEYVVMEVSSHSIDQGRVAGLKFTGGVFTNITQDHLDYHKTFAEYLRVKTKFFKDLPSDSWAAINNDDPHAQSIIAQTKAQVYTYGMDNRASVHAENVKVVQAGVSYTANTFKGSFDLALNLTGDFNIYNSLGALTAGLAEGFEPSMIKQGLESISVVPGRFQRVPESKNFGVIVDYAHTPDGLENILKTARNLTSRRLLLVFGCGGDRDRTKRPIMGEIAARMADFTIITSDNPRSEDPLKIINDIEVGFQKSQLDTAYQVEADRAKAIRKIIAMADEDDLVMIAGKGHETYQDFGDHQIHFDDREVAREALKEKFNGQLQA